MRSPDGAGEMSLSAEMIVDCATEKSEELNAQFYANLRDSYTIVIAAASHDILVYRYSALQYEEPTLQKNHWVRPGHS
jgi:hypothetical protein